jgi:dihydroorotase
MGSRILIRGGRLVDPAAGRDEVADLLIESGKIRKVGRISEVGVDREIDARGLIVSPGWIDMHVHLREPGAGEETIRSGAEAAVAGGVTSVACMPNTEPPLDSEASAEYVLLQAARAGMANVYPIAAVTKGRKGEELTEMGRLSRAGAVAFSDDGAPVSSAELMRRALEYSAMFDKPIINHCQDLDLSRNGVMHEGEVSVRLGLAGIPSESEEIMVSRDIALAAMTGGRLHLAHLSTSGSLEAVRRAKARGLPITCEVAPHHLVLGDEAVARYDADAKMYPPLRTESDRQALIEGIMDGSIDAIATDHAPHFKERKDLGFEEAPFGIVGLETLLPLVVTLFIHERKMSWRDLVSRVTAAPARILGLSGSKGTLAAGSDADIALIDPDREWTIDKNKFRSRSRNTPFHGWKVKGKAVCTLVGGEVKYDLGRE